MSEYTQRISREYKSSKEKALGPSNAESCSPSLTPETDAVNAQGVGYAVRFYAMKTHARNMERERNEARKEAEQWRSTAGDVAAMPITEHPFSWENETTQAPL